MEVTAKEITQDNVAILSGNESQELQVSTSSDLISLLTSDIYTNQELATVREPICNAWDAHFEAHIDTPLEITIKEDMLIIKDFGKGIPDNRMLSVYGTYGRSTRKTDSTTTGGFGLGSKAPLCYADHFQVTSCNNGTKTIYTILKNNDEPVLNKIISVPTTETGLTLEIPLNKEAEHHKLFKKHVLDVCYNGDIKAKITYLDKDISMPETINLDGLQFKLINRNNLANNYTTLIAVRYGSVIYPVPVDAIESTTYRAIAQFLTRSRSHHYGVVLVIHAEPNSITISPSREVITLKSKTKDTINKLLSNWLENVLHYYDTHTKNINLVVETKVMQYIEKTPSTKIHHQRKINMLDVNNSMLPNIISELVVEEYGNKINLPDNDSFSDIALSFALANFSANDAAVDMKYLVIRKLIDVGMLDTVPKKVVKVVSDWANLRLEKSIKVPKIDPIDKIYYYNLKTILKVLGKQNLNLNHLLVEDNTNIASPWSAPIPKSLPTHVRSHGNVVPVKYAMPSTYYKNFKVAFIKILIVNSVAQLKAVKKESMQYSTSTFQFVYMLPTTMKPAEKITVSLQLKEALTRAGFLDVFIASELLPQPEPKVKKPKVVPQPVLVNGIPVIPTVTVATTSKRGYYPSVHEYSKHERLGKSTYEWIVKQLKATIKNPECVVYARADGSVSTDPIFKMRLTPEQKTLLYGLLPEKTVVTYSSKTYKSLLSKGAVDAKQYLCNCLTDLVITTPAFADYYRKNIVMVNAIDVMDTYAGELVIWGYKIPDIANTLKLPSLAVNLSSAQISQVQTWMMGLDALHNRNLDVSVYHGYLKTIELPPNITKALSRINSNTYLNYLDLTRLHKYNKLPAPTQQVILKLLKVVFK